MVAQSWRIVASLPRIERIVLHTIRLACASSSKADIAPAFDGLAQLCVARGLRIAAPEVLRVTPDERVLLAGLAVQQRRSNAAGQFDCGELARALAACGQSLLEDGRRLPLSAAMVSLLRERGWTRIASGGEVSAAPRSPRRGSAKWNVIEYARSRKTVSSAELLGLGISRQYVHLLCRDGVLERVTLGYYRLGAQGMLQPN